MSDFAFQVEADASKADRAIDEVLARLDKLQSDAKRTGASLTSAMTPPKGANEIADQLKRQEQILERIQGPARRYAEDMKALDALYRKNAISAAQYAREVEHLNADLAKNNGKQSSPSLGGAAVGALAGMGAMGAVGAVKGAFETIGSAIEDNAKLADPYIELENSARRFTDTTMSLNQVMAQQGALARDLHSTLAPTMDLYDAIGDVTGDLNLSTRELVGLTKTLGEGALVEGKSLAEAGSVMGRLSIAMQSGADGAGQLRKIFREFPGLGEALAKEWNTDTAGVIHMVSAHQKGITDIVNVWKRGVPELEEQAARIRRTHAQVVAELEEKTNVQIGKGAGITAGFLARAGKDIDDLKVSWQGTSMVIEERGKSVVDITQQIIARNKDLITEWQRADEIVRSHNAIKAIEETLGQLPALLNSATHWLNQFGTALADTPFARALNYTQEHARAVHEAKLQLEALTEVEKAHGRSAAFIAEERKRLNAIINDETQSVHKLTEEYKNLARQLLGGGDSEISAAIRDRERLRRVEEAENQALIEYAGTLESRTTPALENYVHALEQLERVRSSYGLSDAAYEMERQRINKEAMTASGAAGILGAITGAAGAVGNAAGQANGALQSTAIAWHFSDDAAKKAEEDAQRFKEAWATAAGQVTASLLQMSEKGKQSTGDMVESIVRQLAMVMAQQAAARMGGSGGAFLGSLAQALGSVPGHADGTQFTVGGASGRDANFYAMRLSRGERVTVETEEDQRTGKYFGGRGGGGDVQIVNHYQDDPRRIQQSMSSRAGQKVIHNMVKLLPRSRRL